MKVFVLFIAQYLAIGRSFMKPEIDNTERKTKGERTAERILDVAEELFAVQGYDGTSLRQIAERAGIQQPGLYNHFVGKEALYAAVLFRALDPMATALSRHINTASSLREYTDLPAIITDLLLAHPKMAALFQRAIQGDSTSVGNQLVNTWLEKLFNQGMQSLETFGGVTATGTATVDEHNRATLAINLIAMFNLTTGYFLSQPVFTSLAGGDLLEPENIARQKRLLHKVIRAMLIS
jgi:AcrR family transcriptional regulator